MYQNQHAQQQQPYPYQYRQQQPQYYQQYPQYPQQPPQQPPLQRIPSSPSIAQHYQQPPPQQVPSNQYAQQPVAHRAHSNQYQPPPPQPNQYPPQQLQQQYPHQQQLHRIPSTPSIQQQPVQQTQYQAPQQQQQLRLVPSSQSIQQIGPPVSQYQVPQPHNRIPSAQHPVQYQQPQQPPPQQYQPRHAHSQSVPHTNNFAASRPATIVQPQSGRPLPAPSPQKSGPFPPAPQQQQRPPVGSSPSPPRPLPTPSKHQSIDLSRFAPSELHRSRTPSPTKRINGVELPVARRRASPPRFNISSNPPSPSKEDAKPQPEIVLPSKVNLPPLQTAQKFVPMWKQQQQEQQRPQPPSESPSPTRSSGRPLPQPSSPVRSPYTVAVRKGSIHRRTPARTAHEEADEDEESDSEPEREPPSPQYGILDLPRRTPVMPMPPTMTSPSRSLPPQPSNISGLPQPPSMSRSSTTPANTHQKSPQPPFGNGSGSQHGLPQPPAMSRFGSGSGSASSNNGSGSSMTLKFAAMSMDSPSSSLRSSGGGSGGGSGGKWPSNLPRLPQTPRRERAGFDLDDPPPSSFRTSPQPQQDLSRNSWQQQHQEQQQRLPQEQRQSWHSNNHPPPHRAPPLPAPIPTAPPKAPIVGIPATKIESPAPIGGRDKLDLAEIPRISLPDDDDEDHGVPQIQISGEDDNSNSPPKIIFEVPGISIDSSPSNSGPPKISAPRAPVKQKKELRPLYQSKSGLICAGCGGAIIGKIVAAMNLRWHPQCFRCTVCEELLEHVSSYEHEGRPYCHLDYHEMFAPKCYHCETAIIEERFISLNDDALGKRTYHEQHFFCSECGDPFMDPSKQSSLKPRGEINFSGDGVFANDEDDLGFIVYKGYPYCEACHVRLRLPKCKKCGKSLRDWVEAVEALGGKWCYECFVCTGCEKPFENPSFFERNNQPYCQDCFSIILRNEI